MNVSGTFAFANLPFSYDRAMLHAGAAGWKVVVGCECDDVKVMKGITMMDRCLPHIEPGFHGDDFEWGVLRRDLEQVRFMASKRVPSAPANVINPLGLFEEFNVKYICRSLRSAPSRTCSLFGRAYQ